MSLLIKKYQSRVLEKYSIEELENMNLKPLSPSEIAVYYHLKKGLDKVSYYFLYNIRQNDYDIDVLCNKFSFISEKEIRTKISNCKEFIGFFKKENRYSYLEKVIPKFSSDGIFELDITPDITFEEVKGYYIGTNNNKNKVKNRKIEKD